MIHGATPDLSHGMTHLPMGLPLGYHILHLKPHSIRANPRVKLLKNNVNASICSYESVIPLSDTLQIHPDDNVAVALTDGTDVPRGHKVAVAAIEEGDPVIKYGYPIGFATTPISVGAHVHSHNLRTALDGELEYAWHPSESKSARRETGTFEGYVRPDGRVGIRNEIWIINTVGCVNMAAQQLVKIAEQELADDAIDGFYTFNHPFGCSQLGDDMAYTQQVLAGLINHPNAGAVLVMGLGCENNQMRSQLDVVGDYNQDRVRFFNAQEVEDEIETGLEELGKLVEYAQQFKRETVSADRLIIAGKCGASDGYSGITANPLVGRVMDRHCASGGTGLLTEVPEMFGAEQLLMDRSTSEKVFDDVVALINNFKHYFERYDQPIYENPAPGNKAGGITTLEEKSLGCVQKGGAAPVCEVRDYGIAATPGQGGLTLVNAPGNDLVSSTALAAAGAQMVLFTTGRGTPLGVPVPTVKISSNSELAQHKKRWVDFDAGKILSEGTPLDTLADEFYAYILSVASGQPVQNEINGYREIGIWKSGVTL